MEERDRPHDGPRTVAPDDPPPPGALPDLPGHPPVPGLVHDVQRALGEHPLVNLTGPLGIGKSTLAAHLPGTTRIDLGRADGVARLQRELTVPRPEPLVVDECHDARRTAAAWQAFSSVRRPARPVLLVTRKPALSLPGWSSSRAATLTVPPPTDREIEAMSAAARLHD